MADVFNHLQNEMLEAFQHERALLDTENVMDNRRYMAGRLEGISRCIAIVQQASIDTAMASDWQPIETAPKDGRRLWLYEPSYGYEGWWHTDFPRGEAYWMDDADSEPQPTHWRALPAPPQVQTS